MLTGLVPELYLRDPATGAVTLRRLYCDQETFLNNDSYVLAAQVGSRDEWEHALADALAEEAKRKATDYHGFRGIPYLECAEPGLRLLTAEDLALVLGIADGPMAHRPWAAIASDAIGRLTADDRARAIASTEARGRRERPRRPSRLRPAQPAPEQLDREGQVLARHAARRRRASHCTPSITSPTTAPITPYIRKLRSAARSRIPSRDPVHAM